MINYYYNKVANMKSKVIIFITVFFWLILSISGIVGFVESN